MLTLKLKTRNEINIAEYCENYSYMFRRIYIDFLAYSNLTKDEKRDYRNALKRFNLDSWIVESALIEVKAKYAQQNTFAVKREKELIRLEAQLENETNPLFKNRLYKKIRVLKTKNSVIFGLKSVLQKISFLSNTNKEEVAKWKDVYKKNRTLPISICGEMLKEGNRKFKFDFDNKRLVFQPKSGEQHEIFFYASKGQMAYLYKLQATLGEQAISVRLNNDYVWITFDEQKLANYHFDKVGWLKSLKSIPKENKEERSALTKWWHNEQRERQLRNKIESRILAFDLNPKYIGFVISDGDKILHKQVINLNQLGTKLKLSSTDLKQVYQNHKRRYEIIEAWKYIFKIANHYKVAKCAMEELSFRQEVNSEYNQRTTKSIWHRELTEKAIQKSCNIFGIELIEVNAAYSSFIGNIQNNYFDPLNAAIEIARRGQTKYLKGGFYPPIRRSDLDTMYHLGLDVLNKTIQSWVEAYKLFKTAELRYRRELKNFVETNLQSHKSRTVMYSFV